tara:strand:+ start:825 stop:965 length:141 start_codon:yes stop_codon:yes gene_type:complete
MKLQQLNNGMYMIGLPKAIANAKQWKKGDEIKIEITESGDIVLKKK